MSGSNQQIVQGTLNRLLTQLTLANYPALNVSSGNFSKSFMTASLSGPFTTVIPTATGVVNSPEPYTMGTFSFGLLRSQSLANTWLAQVKNGTVLGTVIGYSDSAAFPSIQLVNSSVTGFDPGAFDGQDATVGVTIQGVYYINNSSWV